MKGIRRTSQSERLYRDHLEARGKKGVEEVSCEEGGRKAEVYLLWR